MLNATGRTFGHCTMLLIFLGGGLAFNSIYRIVREHDVLLDKYIIELFINLIKSLHLYQDADITGN